MSTIYCIGCLTQDINVNVERFPQKGEQVKGYGLETIPGGKAQNQAIAARYYGADVKLLGTIGDDLYGEAIKKNLTSYNVPIDNIKTVKGAASAIKLIARSHGEKQVIRDTSLDDSIYEEDILSFLDTAKKGDILLTSLELSVSIVKYALKLASDKEMIIILNLAPATHDVIQLLPLCNYVILNERNLMELTGSIELENASNSLKSLNTIITQGNDGVYFVDEDVKFPALNPDKVVDTYAAGDIFIGAFACLLSQGKRAIEAVDFARGAASLSCQSKGGILSIKEKSLVLKAIDRDDL